MRKIHKLIFASVILFLLSGIGLLIHLMVKSEFKKDDGHEHRVGEKSLEKIDFKPVSNLTYRTTCAECHFPYPTDLLPASSWKIILGRMKDHFGEEVPINPKSRDEIINYLTENGADRSASKKSIKIVKSLKGQTPLRITEIPYIRDKHHEISEETLNRKTIGSLSNCIACHKKAEQGSFDEDEVEIPN
jgi:hypothetical protein